MNVERFRKLCLSMPGATEHVQWGNDLVFKVGGRMFAVAALDADASHRVSFKCSDEQFVVLQECDGVVAALPLPARSGSRSSASTRSTIERSTPASARLTRW